LYKNYFNDDILHLPIDSGESVKTLETVEHIIYFLQSNNIARDDTIVSFGGGIISDLVGFAAAIYMRGMNWVNVPSTLMAQVDASIGGKTGCNFNGIKNQIGAFYQPKCVFIDIELLNTLSDREYIAGIAEVIKYAMIEGKPFFNWVQDHAQQILIKDPTILEEMITRCCKIKRAIVAADERDNNVRMMLNLGHTFGHAIETVTNYKIIHGEAVAYGMLLATRQAVKLGAARDDLFVQLSKILEVFALPYSLSALPFEVSELYDAMLQDKKKSADKHRFVLPIDIGEVEVRDLEFSHVST